MWHYGLELPKVCQNPAKFGANMYCGSADKLFLSWSRDFIVISWFVVISWSRDRDLVIIVISEDPMIKGSYNFMARSPSR